MEDDVEVRGRSWKLLKREQKVIGGRNGWE